MEHLPLPETANRENLERMARITVRIPQTSFHMRAWQCGTQACMGGHCYAQVTAQPLKDSYENDAQISQWLKAFTGLQESSDFWLWCFWGSWSDYDNTPEGACRRVLYLLNYGLPKDFTYPLSKWVDLYMNANLDTYGKQRIRQLVSELETEKVAP